MQTPRWQRRVMRRVGAVLVLIGVLDIGYCAVSLAGGADSYSSSFNIFALVAGITVYRGNLGAVRLVVNWFSFMLGAFALTPVLGAVAAYTFSRLGVPVPTDVGSWLWSAVLYVASMALLYWIRQSLAALPVFEGDRPAKPLLRMPATAVGVALALVLTVVFFTVGFTVSPDAVQLTMPSPTPVP